LKLKKPNPNKKTGKKTEQNKKQTEPNRFEPVFVIKNQTEIGQFEPNRK
jgi:hypothetical protein